MTTRNPIPRILLVTPAIAYLPEHVDSNACYVRVENEGIDAAPFWQQLYYERMPGCYEETREFNPIDLLASGIFSADVAALPDKGFLRQALADHTNSLPQHLKLHVEARLASGSVVPIKSVMPPVLSKPDVCNATKRYIELYETIMEHPLIPPENEALMARQPFDLRQKRILETKEAQPRRPAKKRLKSSKDVKPSPLLALRALKFASR
jgi:hypothetical protein